MSAAAHARPYPSGSRNVTACGERLSISAEKRYRASFRRRPKGVILFFLHPTTQQSRRIGEILWSNRQARGIRVGCTGTLLTDPQFIIRLPCGHFDGENNEKAKTWKKKLGSFGHWTRLHGTELRLRPSGGQAGGDLADSSGCRTRRHIFRHRRSLWSVHKRGTRW